MASLPSNTFLVNYNAKNYNPSTHTIPNEQGAIFAQDMILNAAAALYTDDHITVNGQYYNYQFSSASDNPFNRSGNNAFTIIAKTSKGTDTSGEHAIASCRYPGLNWILFNPANGCDNSYVFLHNNNRYYYTCPYTTISSQPNIYAIRVNNGQGFGQSFTDGTTQRTTGVTFGSTATRFGIFTDTHQMGGFEIWKGDFYWIYISTEALTDVEIQQVIDFNEGGGLSIDPESVDFSYTGGSSSLTITANGEWTASTNEAWITLSSTAGTGNSTITVTANENTSFQPKLGTINVTDDSDTLTCTISQDKNPVFVKSDNIYIEDTLIKKMYLNGSLIYQNLFKFIFNVSTSAETVDATGGTFSATITANRPWSITAPEWISASTVSGKSSATVTFTVGENSGETQRTGNIEVICNGVTKQINVSQKSNIDYSTMYLTFEIISGGTFGYSFWTNLNWEYTTDDGTTWTTIPSFGAFSINVNAGDKIKMRGNESGGYGNNWFGWSTTTAKFNVYGNIMSIVDSVNYATMTTVPSDCFRQFFNNCTGLVSAENLILPATTLAENCYYYMFYNCTSLTTAPSVLPATTLASSCYQQMFQGCSSLTTAPDLPATTLETNCYDSMFWGCSSLNYIKCLATDISASSCTLGWVNGVSQTGTFVKNPNMHDWPQSYGNYNGIPNGWTVIDE